MTSLTGNAIVNVNSPQVRLRVYAICLHFEVLLEAKPVNEALTLIRAESENLAELLSYCESKERPLLVCVFARLARCLHGIRNGSLNGIAPFAFVQILMFSLGQVARAISHDQALPN